MTPARGSLRAQPRLQAILDDPFEFMSRLKILLKSGKKRFFYPMWEETEHYVRNGLLGGRKYVFALKPRQVAYTTATVMYEFWKGYTSPHAHRCVQVAHHPEALTRLKEMVEVAHDGLPRSMQRGLKPHNDDLTRFQHNGAGFNRIIAGSRSEARAWAFNDAHLSEVCKYPSSTPSNARDAAGGVDESVWQSVLATLDEGSGDERVFVESTGNGPRGLGYGLFQQAQLDPEWTYIFLPWSKVGRYARRVRDRDDFMAGLDDQEVELHRLHGLTAEQLAWRRHKLTTEKYSLQRFRREYPLTDLEPFMLASSGWYDQETLVRLLACISDENPLARDATQPLRVFHPVGCECGCGTRHDHKFFIGGDPSFGVGKDWSVVHVLRQDLLHCATWMSNTTRPRGQAREIAKLGAAFGGDWSNPPLALIEANNEGGRQVLDALRAMGAGAGVRLWADPATGRDFYSTGAGAGDRKREIMDYSREIIEEELTIVEDVFVILQMQGIVQKWNGKIEARDDDATTFEAKDDSVVAYALALYAARPFYQRNLVRFPSDTVANEQARRTRLVHQRFGDRREGL